jgi:hypothetical protein
MVGKLTGYQPQDRPIRHSNASLTNHPSIDHQKLLINGVLDAQDSVLAERKGVVSRDSRKSCKGES